MVMLDKGYFDYDYEHTEKPQEFKIKSDEEVRYTLSSVFGFKHLSDKPKTTEELQEFIIKDMEEK